MKNPKFYDKRGFCTSYAHRCGYLDTAELNGDTEHVTMYAEGAVYQVRARKCDAFPAGYWMSYDANTSGRKVARKAFMYAIRCSGAKRKIHKG